MSNINLPSEQPSSSNSSRGVSISNKNTGESASTLAAVVLNENSNNAAAEEEKYVATATGTSSSYSSPPQPSPPQEQQQQEPSVDISLSDITKMLDPFFGTSTTLPSSSQQQQQQRGGPHHECITDVAAEGLTKHVGTEDEAPCSPVEHPRGLTSGDENSGDADDIQGMEEFMEAPGNSWIETVWEMELEKSRMVP